jgi:hypothetical protein
MFLMAARIEAQGITSTLIISTSFISPFNKQKLCWGLGFAKMKDRLVYPNSGLALTSIIRHDSQSLTGRPKETAK